MNKKKKYNKIQFNDFENSRIKLAKSLYFANMSKNKKEYDHYVKESGINGLTEYYSAKLLLRNNSQAGVKETHTAFVLADILGATKMYPDEYETNYDCIIEINDNKPIFGEIKTNTLDNKNISEKFGDCMLNGMDADKREQYIRDNPYIVFPLYTQDFLVAMVAGYYLDMFRDGKPMHEFVLEKTFRKKKNNVNISFSKVSGIEVIYVNELAIHDQNVIDRCSKTLLKMIETFKNKNFNAVSTNLKKVSIKKPVATQGKQNKIESNKPVPIIAQEVLNLEKLANRFGHKLEKIK